VMPAQIDLFRERWGERWPDARTYTDYREMLERERPEIISVCTPDDLHADVVVDACAAGVRGIFCEKPLATTIVDARRMLAAAARADVVLSIDHTRRWMPDYVQARHFIQNGRIGEVRRIVATLGGPRAMLFRNGTHLVDMICYLTGAGAIWVSAELDEGFEDYFAYRGDGGRDPATDPGGSGYIHLSTGARAFVNASKRTPTLFELDVLGTRGRIRIDDRTADLWQTSDDGVSSRQPFPRSSARLTGVAAGLAEVISALKTGAPVSSTGSDGLRALQILIGMLESQRRGNSPVAVVDLG
jgi:predicted dehydrogenase